MIDDPIVEDIYQARQKILDRYNGDLTKWMEHLKAAEARHPDRLVTLETVRKKRESAERRRLTESHD